MKKEDGRLRGMDGLRGVAIIAITLFHMFPSVLGWILRSCVILCINWILVGGISKEEDEIKKSFHCVITILPESKEYTHHYL